MQGITNTSKLLNTDASFSFHNFSTKKQKSAQNTFPYAHHLVHNLKRIDAWNTQNSNRHWGANIICHKYNWRKKKKMYQGAEYVPYNASENW